MSKKRCVKKIVQLCSVFLIWVIFLTMVFSSQAEAKTTLKDEKKDYYGCSCNIKASFERVNILLNYSVKISNVYGEALFCILYGEFHSLKATAEIKVSGIGVTVSSSSASMSGTGDKRVYSASTTNRENPCLRFSLDSITFSGLIITKASVSYTGEFSLTYMDQNRGRKYDSLNVVIANVSKTIW